MTDLSGYIESYLRTEREDGNWMLTRPMQSIRMCSLQVSAALHRRVATCEREDGMALPSFEDTNPFHYTWGHHPENYPWCEIVFQWLGKVRLAEELQAVRNSIDTYAALNAMGNIDNVAGDRLGTTQNMRTFTTECKDPATIAN
eukprot:1266986-Amphidinium_carterae.4